MTTREITEASQQRNTSAVTYHFGSREGLLLEILARRGAPIDEERGRMREALGEDPPVREVVRCLVEPYCSLLNDAATRSYLRIVAQLRGRFAAWRVESDASTTRNLSLLLDEIEQGLEGEPAVRQERVLGLIILLTGATAVRARSLDDGQTPDLDHDIYVENLVDMCTAVLLA